MSTPVVDLHCDLPLYLALAEPMGENRTLDDAKSRCSVPQMREGGVIFQTLAIFAPPMPDSGDFGLREAEVLARTLEHHPHRLRAVRAAGDLEPASPDDASIGVMAALEGGDAFSNPGEPLGETLARFDRMLEVLGPVLYTSLTWVADNRFGGGNGGDQKGLSADGRVMLEYLAERGVPVDLSHACPRLAHDVLDFTYSHGLEIEVLASHSPYAGVLDLPRNLTDDAAREIKSRGGVIGLNVMARYVVGDAPQALVDQMLYAREIGVLEGAQALGADFFCDLDVPPEMRKGEDDPDFFKDFGNSSCYPRLLEAIQEGLAMGDQELAAIAHGNALGFIRRALAAQT
ncbi:MAG: membrane dipeptidase [Acidobacteriota bacterium]